MREDWIEVELLEIGEIITGGTPSKKNPEYYTSNDKPFFKPTDLNAGIFVNTSKDYLSNKGFDNSRNAPAGSVLVTCIGATIGKTGLIHRAGAFNQQINAVVPYTICESLYAFYYISSHSFQSQILAKSSSTTMPILNKSKFSILSFPLPPLPEQRAIVAKIEVLFSSLDNGIANLEKAQEQLKVYRQAVLKKAFEGELTKEWREKQTDLPSAEELLEQIKTERENYYEQQLADWKIKVDDWEENGKEGKKPGKPKKLTVPELPTEKHERRKWALPKEWMWTQVGDLCFITKLAGFEYTDYVNYADDGDLFVIKAENAGPLGYRHKVYSKVRYNEVKSLERSIVKGGELLVVFVGAGTGNVATVQFDKKYFLGPNIGMGRPYFTMSTRFIELFLQSSVGKNVMMSTVKAVAQPSLSMGSIRQSPIIFASHKEQLQLVQEIESRLSVCDKVEESIVIGLKKSEALKQSILKKAFEGALLSEVELEACRKEVDWEPAEVLLERIKKEKKK